MLRKCGLYDTNSLKFVGSVILYSVTYLGCLNLFCCFLLTPGHGSLFLVYFVFLYFELLILD